MSDVESLLGAFGSGELLRPSPEVPNIVDLSRALASLSGADGLPPAPGWSALAELISPSDHLLFLLVDGLGMNLIERLPGTSFLQTHLVTELRTAFPSTTASVLTSIATGEWPGQHAVTGWWTHLPEIGAAMVSLPFVARSDGRSLRERGVTAEQAFPLPSLLRRARRDTLALFPQQIAASVYSAYFCGGSARHGYRSLREAVDLIVARIQSAEGPTYTYLYTPQVDSTAHRHGLGRPEVRAVLAELERELERLVAGLAGRGRLVLSADHGLLDTPDGARHQIRASDPLMAGLRFPPSGDSRVLYFHLRDGAEAPFRKDFQERFGERFLLISTDEAEGLGLFGPGPLLPPTRSRLGELIAISRGPDVMEYLAFGGTGRVVSQACHHSGLTPAEMRVPLVIA